MYFGAFTLTNAIMTQEIPVIKFMLRSVDDNIAVYSFLYKHHKIQQEILFYFTCNRIYRNQIIAVKLAAFASLAA